MRVSVAFIDPEMQRCCCGRSDRQFQLTWVGGDVVGKGLPCQEPGHESSHEQRIDDPTGRELHESSKSERSSGSASDGAFQPAIEKMAGFWQQKNRE
jgi:hypothetical protein